MFWTALRAPCTGVESCVTGRRCWPDKAAVLMRRSIHILSRRRMIQVFHCNFFGTGN